MNHIHTSYKLSAAESRAKKAAIVDDTVHNEDVLFHYHIIFWLLTLREKTTHWNCSNMSPNCGSLLGDSPWQRNGWRNTSRPHK